MLAWAKNGTLKKPPAEAGDKFRYARPEGQGVNFRPEAGHHRGAHGALGGPPTLGKSRVKRLTLLPISVNYVGSARVSGAAWEDPAETGERRSRRLAGDQVEAMSRPAPL
jgi:hypothetical protein